MKMEHRNNEQHYTIKFGIKLNETSTEAYEQLKVSYWDYIILCAHVFKEIDENAEMVQVLIMSDHQLTAWMIADST